MPFWQGLVGAAFVAAIVLAVLGVAAFWSGGPSWQLAALLPARLRRDHPRLRRGPDASDGLRGWLVGFLVGHVYTLYTWLLWPVLVRSAARQLGKRRDWAKTEREPIEDEAVAPVRPRATVSA